MAGYDLRRRGGVVVAAVVTRMNRLTFMFVYRPPKSSCWGHSIGTDQTTALPKFEAFVDTYFERVEQGRLTTLVLAWKNSVLPKIDWPDVFLGPDKQKWRQLLFVLNGNRVGFPMGIVFPLSVTDAASFEFLKRFSEGAPFQMSAKHFMVGIEAKNGKFAWRKPDVNIAAKLAEYIDQ
jgi:hypothetical protein